MCTGACLLYKTARVVIGENESFMGGESLLRDSAVEVVVLRNASCKDLMHRYIEDNRQQWHEDIGEQ